MTSIRSLHAVLVLCTASLLTAHAAAQAPNVPMAGDNARTPTALAPVRSAFVAPAVDSATLDSYRGGSSLVSNDLMLAGTTADNTAHNVNTGNNAISAGAFANMNGMPVVIQNSGANVLIQNAVIVHVQMN
ncbi:MULTISPECIES: hypothetical protein [unclassified Acidovorax]|jgi:hypothetical protein|uniref:hypothetical protein n=1 Tax=unclassified Acidovorax TaxID=2684926 RepID=UPI0004659E50|nr:MULTISPECIES: hypothetical protein [unclassified Acidovorax]HQS22562.1 hypothetical protein [Acidovorax defluvii]HQS63403.1 hypothetical protein [Acidovorax defluvii]HQT16250.1 hypothetical protein [Acidovorax defluvii]HQT50922.1 hypothetical protein [Acidovorax defluvii]